MITDESLEMRWVPNWSDPAHLPAYLQIHLFKNLDCNNNCKILDLILVVKSNSAARTMTKGRQGSYKYLKIKIKRWGDAAGEDLMLVVSVLDDVDNTVNLVDNMVTVDDDSTVSMVDDDRRRKLMGRSHLRLSWTLQWLEFWWQWQCYNESWWRWSGNIWGDGYQDRGNESQSHHDQVPLEMNHWNTVCAFEINWVNCNENFYCIYINILQSSLTVW